MVHAGVEGDVAQQVLGDGGALHPGGQAVVAAPVVRDGAPTMGDDQPERREAGEQVTLQQLHEHRGVRVEVVGTKRVEVRVAGAGDVDHGRNIELDHLLVQGEPRRIGQGPARP